MRHVCQVIRHVARVDVQSVGFGCLLAAFATRLAAAGALHSLVGFVSVWSGP